MRYLLLALPAVIFAAIPVHALKDGDNKLSSAPPKVVSCASGLVPNAAGVCVDQMTGKPPAKSAEGTVAKVSDATIGGGVGVIQSAKDLYESQRGQAIADDNTLISEPAHVKDVSNPEATQTNVDAPQVANLKERAPQTTVSYAPPKNETAQRDREDVSRLIPQNPAQAHQLAVEALKRTPDDPALRAMAKFTEPAKTAVESKTVKSRIAELMAGTRREEAAGTSILASPIGFGAATPGSVPAAAAGAAALSGGMSPAALARENPILKDAYGKIAIKDYAGAESELSRHIAANPGDGSAFRLRSLSRRFQNRFVESVDDAKKAVELNPKDALALHLLSRDYTDMGRPKEALAEADRALTLNPRDPDAYLARAVANRALGQNEAEIADLARAASLDAQFEGLYHEALAVRGGGGAPRSQRSWAVWLGAIGTALLFFSFALFRKRGDSSVRVALRREDHEGFVAAAPRVDAVPKGFRVVKTLGQGGMGVVYEAVDLGLQRTVALKKLRAEIADNPRERGRFLKEARTVAALHHANIVEIHSIHEDGEGLFLVFERVPGETLHERIGRGALAPADAAAYLKQIASALDYAHGQGVVHQDLKPGNVMIHGGLAKVMDFGIARRVQETLSTMSKIEVSGTPAYMSPEQEQGVVTPSADVFALGACAYETLTGALPFPTGGLMLKAQKMYRKPSEARAGLSAGVDTAIARALEPRPEDRWPSASSFVDALSRALS